MSRTKIVAALAAAIAGGATAYRFRVRRARSSQGAGDRWHVVTVNRPLDEVTAGLPDELVAPAGAIEWRLRPAPGGRGTEIHARAIDDNISAARLRLALRNSRSVLEAGDVLQAGGPTTTPTLRNRYLRAATRHGREGGLL